MEETTFMRGKIEQGNKGFVNAQTDRLLVLSLKTLKQQAFFSAPWLKVTLSKAQEDRKILTS